MSFKKVLTSTILLTFMLSIICIPQLQASVVWTEFDLRAPVFSDRASNITYLTSFGQYIFSKETGAIQYVYLNGTVLSPSTKFIVQYLEAGDSWEDFELSQPEFLEVKNELLQWRQTVKNGSQGHGVIVFNSVFSDESPPKLSAVWNKLESYDVTFRILFKVTIPQAWEYFINGEEFVNIPKTSALSLVRKKVKIVESPERSVLRLLVDWSDYGEAIVELKGSTVTVVFGINLNEVDPTVSGTAIDSSATSQTQQRKIQYVNGRYWAFFADTTNNGVFMSSSDGETWQNKTSIGDVNEKGFYLSTWANSTHLAYVRSDANKLFYRLGAPQSNGSITWLDSEQEVWNPTEPMVYPVLEHDSNGKPFIAVMNYSTGVEASISVVKSDLANGTWSTSSGHPLELIGFGSLWKLPSIASLTSAKMYVFLSCANGTVYGRQWNTTAWESAEVVATGAFRVSVVSINDDLHVVYSTAPTPNAIKYKSKTGASWSSATTLETGLTVAQVALLKDGLKLFAVWSDNAKNIYVKGLLAGSWTSSVYWTRQTNLAQNSISAMYQKIGSKAGAIWTSGGSSPFTVSFLEFDYIDTVSSFSIYNTDNALPVTSPAWDEVNKKLSFNSAGNLTVDAGSLGQPVTVWDGQDFLSWSMSGSNISFTATGSTIEVSWVWTPDVETIGTGEPEEDEEMEIFEDGEPIGVDWANWGLYGLVAGMAVVTVGGIASALTKRKGSRKVTGKTMKVKTQPSGKGTNKVIKVKGSKAYGGVKPKGVGRKKQKWD